MTDMRKLIDIVADVTASEMPIFDELLIVREIKDSGLLCEVLISGRFDRNIRIDAGSHLDGGDKHAHVFGRRGEELVVVKVNGSSSHGTKGKLHQKDADVLRAKEFKIRADNIVEWQSIGHFSQILLG